MGLNSPDKHCDDLPQGLASLTLIVLLYIIYIDFKPLIVFYSVVNQNFL
jgi:hypothetical protein